MPNPRRPRQTPPREPGSPPSAEQHQNAGARPPGRPSETPSPTPTVEGSAGSLTDSSAGSGFVADPGPAFDPRSAPEPPPLEPETAELIAAAWEESQVREFLTMQGQVTHAVLRVGPDDTESWIHTEQDLKAIAPPLTRILNRYDATRAAAAAGDELVLIAAVGRYGARNYVRRRRLLAEQANAGPVPVTGREAPPDTGPDADPEYMRTLEPQPPAPTIAELRDVPPALTPKGVGH